MKRISCIEEINDWEKQSIVGLSNGSQKAKVNKIAGDVHVRNKQEVSHPKWAHS